MPQTTIDLMNVIDKASKNIQNLNKFIRKELQVLCRTCVKELKAHTYGEKLPKEWSYRTSESGAVIYHRRLEGNRSLWEPIFVWHNNGTPAHWIYPINAKALRWEENGNVKYSKGHMVSGIAPQQFAERCDRLIADFEKELPKKVERFLNS